MSNFHEQTVRSVNLEVSKEQAIEAFCDILNSKKHPKIFLKILPF